MAMLNKPLYFYDWMDDWLAVEISVAAGGRRNAFEYRGQRSISGVNQYDWVEDWHTTAGSILTRNPLTPGYGGAGFTGSIFSSSIFVPQDRSRGTMGYSPGAQVWASFTLQRIDTGFATDADSLGQPSGRVKRNGLIQDGSGSTTNVTVTFAKDTGETGSYTATFTVPSGWSANDSIQLLVRATVNGVSGKDIVESFMLEAASGGSGITAAQVTAAVLDADLSMHSGAGSPGGALSTILTNSGRIPASPAAQGDAMTLTTPGIDSIWNRLRSAVTRPTGSFGDFLDSAVSGAVSGAGGAPSAATIAAAVWNSLTSGLTTTGSIGKLLAALKLSSGGYAQIDLTQSVGYSQTAGTVGRALQLARAQAAGKWVIDEASVPATITLYDLDGTTVVKVLELTPNGGPFLTRTPTTTD